jgi:ketosteroid isomerase-like protein
MAEHPDIALVKRGYAAFNRADVDTLSALIAADAVQHMLPGNTPVSGRFEGRDAILGMYARLGEESAGTFRAEPELYTTDGEGRIAVLHHITGTRQGLTLDEHEVLVFTLRDGVVVELRDLATDPGSNDRWWGLPVGDPAEHPDVAIVRRGFEAFNGGDFDTLTELMADDVEHHVPGSNLISGTYKGRDDVFGLYRRIAELTGFQFTAVPDALFTDGRGTVGALVRGTGSRQGRTLDSMAVLLFNLDAGKVTRIHELYEDLDAENEFWS